MKGKMGVEESEHPAIKVEEGRMKLRYFFIVVNLQEKLSRLNLHQSS